MTSRPNVRRLSRTCSWGICSLALRMKLTRSTPVDSHFFSSRMIWSGLPMAIPSGGSPGAAGPAAERRVAASRPGDG